MTTDLMTRDEKWNRNGQEDALSAMNEEEEEYGNEARESYDTTQPLSPRHHDRERILSEIDDLASSQMTNLLSDPNRLEDEAEFSSTLRQIMDLPEPESETETIRMSIERLIDDEVNSEISGLDKRVDENRSEIQGIRSILANLIVYINNRFESIYSDAVNYLVAPITSMLAIITSGLLVIFILERSIMAAPLFFLVILAWLSFWVSHKYV